MKVAEAGEVDYKTALGWVCEDGYSIGDIKNAQRIAEFAGISMEETLRQYDELGNWGAVKQALGLTGEGEKDKEGSDSDSDDESDDKENSDPENG